MRRALPLLIGIGLTLTACTTTVTGTASPGGRGAQYLVHR